MNTLFVDYQRASSIKAELREKEKKDFTESVSRKFSDRREQLEKEQRDSHQLLQIEQDADEKKTRCEIQHLNATLKERTEEREKAKDERNRLFHFTLDQLSQEQRSEIDMWLQAANSKWAAEIQNDDEAFGRQIGQMARNQSQAGSTQNTQVPSTAGSQFQEDACIVVATKSAVPVATTPSSASVLRTEQLKVALSLNLVPQMPPATVLQIDGSTQQDQISDDSDDEPLISSRKRKRGSVTSESLIRDNRTVQIQDVAQYEGIKELLEGSGEYYVLRCPECPYKRFTGFDALKSHYNNKRTEHNTIMNMSQLEEICSVLVRDATASWVQEHNHKVHNYKELMAKKQSTDTVSNISMSQQELNKSLEDLTFTGKDKENRDTAIYAPVVPGFDGFYHHPQYMKDVPVQKINERSEYWEATWKTWEDYLNIPTSYKARKMLLKQRRNIKEFFERFPQHPNQLLSKKYITDTGLLIGQVPLKMHIVLVNLERAKNAGRISIEPFDWLRRRLMKLIQIHESRGLDWKLKYNFETFGTSDVEYLRVCEGIDRHESAVLEDSELEAGLCNGSVEPKENVQSGRQQDTNSSTTSTQYTLRRSYSPLPLENGKKRERHASEGENASPRPSKIQKRLQASSSTSNSSIAAAASANPQSFDGLNILKTPACISSHGSPASSESSRTQSFGYLSEVSHRATNKTTSLPLVDSQREHHASLVGKDVPITKLPDRNPVGSPFVQTASLPLVVSSREEDSTVAFRLVQVKTWDTLDSCASEILQYKWNERAEALEPFHINDKRVIIGSSKLLIALKDVISLAYRPQNTVVLTKRYQQDQSYNSIQLSCKLHGPDEADRFFSLLYHRNVYVKDDADMDRFRRFQRDTLKHQ